MRLLNSIYVRNCVSKGGDSNSSELENKKPDLNEILKVEKAVPKAVKLRQRRRPVVDLSKSRGISVKHIQKENEHSRVFRHFLEDNPDKEGFIQAIEAYQAKNKIRQGHIDFIATGLKFMEAYGLSKEGELYDRLLDCMPRGRVNNKSFLDTLLPPAHPQMFLAIDLLHKMEENGVYPSDAMYEICKEVFGKPSAPLRKISRTRFWMDEYYDLNPYWLDNKVYMDRVNIIRAAIERILGSNDGTKILEISPPVEDDDSDMINYSHFIISSFTDKQRHYLTCCNPENVSIYIEGPLFIWVNRVMEEYFIMKTGQNELTSIRKKIKVAEDEEREGVIMGICFATKPYQDTLLRWLKYMQEEHPVLRDVNVVFDISDDSSNEETKKISN